MIIIPSKNQFLAGINLIFPSHAAFNGLLLYNYVNKAYRIALLLVGYQRSTAIETK